MSKTLSVSAIQNGTVIDHITTRSGIAHHSLVTICSKKIQSDGWFESAKQNHEIIKI